MQVSLGRSVGVGLLRAPVMPKQEILASETILGPCRCDVAEIHVFDPSSRRALQTAKHASKKNGKISDLRPTPELATSASAAAHNSPFCARCDLRPKAPKANNKNARAQRDSNLQPPICVYICAPPATAPLHVGSSWPEQKMGSFGSFLYIKNVPRRIIIFGCPPSVVGTSNQQPRARSRRFCIVAWSILGQQYLGAARNPNSNAAVARRAFEGA